MRKILLALTLLLSASAAAFSQTDQVDVSSAKVFNSPLNMMKWSPTASVTSVTFSDVGFNVQFDKKEGPNRWPDAVTPGWDGPLQYTLGLCRLRNASVPECSAVVQFWHGRQEQDAHASAAPNEVGKEWFYDSRWGALTGWQPAVGEDVGIFVCRGDCRGNVPPTTERSNVVRVKWGTSQTFQPTPPGSVEPPTSPTPAPVEPPVPPAFDPAPLTQRITSLENALAAAQQAILDLAAKLTLTDQSVERIDSYIVSKPIPVSCKASVFGIPVSCSLGF